MFNYKKINKSTNNNFWRGCEERGALLHYWWECNLVQPLLKAVWSSLKTLKVEMPCDTVILLLGIYLKKPEALIQKNICTPMFTAALFTLGKIWKQPKCP